MSDRRADIVAELNDLLQLDHDAIDAYSLAIAELQDAAHRETLLAFRADHERHVVALTQLVREHEGTPIQVGHASSSVFKMTVQQAGALGGTRGILMAFKANEGQVRDKYRRAAARGHSPTITEVLQANAADEEKHYQWVSDELERMGAGGDTLPGKLQHLFESVHSLAADAMELAEKRVTKM
jgi:rubrerythrin